MQVIEDKDLIREQCEQLADHFISTQVRTIRHQFRSVKLFPIFEYMLDLSVPMGDNYYYSLGPTR